MLIVTDNIDEEEVSDFQLDLFFGLGHALLQSLFRHQSGKDFAKARIAA
jgi:hypothetical protein